MVDDTQVATILLRVQTAGLSGFTETSAGLREVDAAARAQTASVQAAANGIQGMGAAGGGSSAKLAELASVVRTATAGAGLLATGFGVYGVAQAAKFDDSLQKIQGNTGQTTGQMASMRAEILKLGAEGPQSLDTIAQGFEHAANLGYQGADATNLVTAAWKAAIATGGQTGDMVNVLATQMRNFHEPASQAAQVMGELLTASQAANIHLPDLTANFSKVGIIASSMHQPLSETVSLYSSLTRATGDAALSQTLLTGILNHILNPTKQAKDLMAQLARSTGVDLVQASKEASDGQITLSQYMDRARRATGGNAQEIMTLFGGIRGGVGALQTLNSGWMGYHDILGKVTHSQSELNIVFDAMMKTFGAQFGTLTNNVREISIEVGQTLLPGLTQITTDIRPVVAGIRDWTDANPRLATSLLEVGVGLGAVSLGISGFEGVSGRLRLLLPFGNQLARDFAFLKATEAEAGAGATRMGEQMAVAASTGAAPLTVAVDALDLASTRLAADLVGTGAAVAVIRSEMAVAAGETVALEAATAGVVVEEGAAIGVMGQLASVGGLVTGALGSGGLLGAVGALLAPEVAIPALAAIFGVIAYEKSPALRREVGTLADGLKGTLSDSFTGATHAASLFGDALTAVNQKMDQTGTLIDARFGDGKGNPVAEFFGRAALGTLENLPQSAMVARVIDMLQQEGLAKEDAARKADAHTAAVRREMEAHLQYYAMMQRFAGSAPSGAGAASPTPGSQPKAPDYSAMGSTLTKAATDALDAYAGALTKNAPTVDKFGQTATNTAARLEAYDQNLAKGTITVDEATGKWGAALAATTNLMQGQVDDAVGHLALALFAHAHNISDLVAQGKQDVTDQKRLAADRVLAEHLLGVSTTKASTAVETFAQTLSKASDTAFEHLVKAVFTGHGSQSDAAAAHAQRSEDRYTDVSASVKQTLDAETGNWADWLSQERQKLQKRVDAAEGQLIFDREHGKTAAIPGDQATLKSAEAGLAHFDKTVNDASASVKKLNAVTDPVTKAQEDARTSLERLQLAIDNGKPIGTLMERAEAAAGTLAKLALSGDQAALKGGSPSDQISAIGDIARKAADALVIGIDRGDGSRTLADLTDKAEQAAGAAQRLTEAENKEAERIGSPSSRLGAHDTIDKNGLSDAEATIALAIDHHRQVTESDIGAAQRHQAAVDADAQANWDASFAAASTAERHALLAQRASEIVSQFNALKGASQSVIDAERTVYADRTTIIKDRLDAMAQAFSDATAIFQAQSTARKDVQAGVVKGIEDGTAVLKGQSGVLDAILQAGLSGSQESAATMREAIQVARDALQTARDQLVADAAAAAWQQQIDSDSISIATAKAHQDSVQASVTQNLARDQLKIDERKATLAEDQLKLTDLTNKGISLLVSHFAGVNDYAQAVRGELKTIERDSGRVDAAIGTLAADSRAGNDRIAAAIVGVGTATQQAALDQRSSDTSSTAGQRRIALDNQLASADQSYLSDLQAVDAATQSVTDALHGLAADQSKALVDSLDSMVTAVSDATAVFSAMAGVSKAREDGAVKAVQDQSGIIKAEGDIAAAKTSAQLAVARDGLRIALDTLQADQTAASWSVRIAQDQVTIAADKQAADALKSAWDHTIDLDTLKIDEDKVKLAQDQLTLSQENLALQAQMVQLLGGDTSQYLAAMPGLLSQIGADQSSIAADQLGMLQDSQTAAQQEAQAALQSAYDSQQLARDQAAADSSSAAQQLRLAQDGNRLAADQVAEQALTNSLMRMSLSDMQSYFGILTGAVRNLKSGVSFHWVGSGTDPFESFINSAPAAFASNPTP